MRNLAIWIAILLIGMGATPVLSAKEVMVREVKVSLFNKPVTGYRFMLDKSQRVVYNDILRHVEAYSNAPFRYENTIIYENIVYPPVTKLREVSLYYLLQGLQGNFCEVTMIVMYDYKRSVNSQEFPDLSMKVLVDIAALVHRVTGDDIRFEDMVLDDKTIREIQANEKKRVEEKIAGEMIGQVQGEDDNNGKVIVRKNPFTQGHDSLGGDGSLIAAINLKAGQIEKREAELEKREAQVATKERELSQSGQALSELMDQNKRLTDSILVMNRRLGLQSMSTLAGDERSVSGRDAEAISLLEDDLRVMKKKNEALERSLDSLRQKNASLTTENQKANSDKRRIEDELRNMWEENTNLRAEYLELKTRIAGLNPGMTQDQMALARLTADLQQARADNNRLKEQLDEVRSMKADSSVASRRIFQLEDSLDYYRKRYVFAGEDQTPGMAAVAKERDNLEKENYLLKNTNKELDAKLKASQTRQRELESEKAGADEYKRQAQALKAENEAAARRYAELQKEMDAVRQSSKKEIVDARLTEEKLAVAQEQIAAANRSLDSLSRVALAESREKEKFQGEYMRMRSRNDSLSNELSAAQKILNVNPGDQRAKLLDQEKKLGSELAALQNRESLIAGREQALELEKQKIAAREVQYKDLQEREDRLKILEQQLRQKGAGEILEEMKRNRTAPASVSSQDTLVYSSVSVEKSLENGELIPQFLIHWKMTPAKSVVHFATLMVRDGFIPEKKDPEFVFEKISLSRVSSQPLTLKLRVVEEDGSSLLIASFRKADGKYIDPVSDPGGTSRAREFLIGLSRSRL